MFQAALTVIRIFTQAIPARYSVSGYAFYLFGPIQRQLNRSTVGQKSVVPKSLTVSDQFTDPVQLIQSRATRSSINACRPATMLQASSMPLRRVRKSTAP